MTRIAIPVNVKGTAQRVVDAAIAELALGTASMLDEADVVLETSRNAANGFLGLDSSGNALGTFCSRRDTAANIVGTTLKSGELAFTTDYNEIFLGDGSTAGGLFLGCTPRTYGQRVVGTHNGSSTASLTSIPVAANATYKVEFTCSYSSAVAASNFGWVIKRSGLMGSGLIFDSNTRASAWGYWSPASSADKVEIFRQESTSTAADLLYTPVINLTETNCGIFGTLIFGVTTSGTIQMGPCTRDGLSESMTTKRNIIVTRVK